MKRLLPLVILMFLAGAVQAAKDEKWFDAYDRGVDAVRAGNHAVAVQALSAAIAEMPAENATARRRNETFVYVPHFWLGIARFNSGDTEGALRSLKTSEQQGVVQNTRYYSDLREWLGRVQVQQQRDAQGVAGEGKRISGAAVKLAVSAQMDAVAAGGDRSDSYRNGLKKLQDARDIAAKAGTDLAEYRRAAAVAAEARALFAQAGEEIRRQKAARAAAPPPARVAASAKPQPQSQSMTPSPAHGAPVVTQTTVAIPAKPQEPEASKPPAISAAVADARVVVQQYRRRLAEAATVHSRDAAFGSWAGRGMRNADEWQKALEGSVPDEEATRIAAQVADRDRELGLRLTDLGRVSAAAKATAPATAGAARAVIEPAFRAYAEGDLARAEALLTAALSTSPTAEAYLLRGCTLFTQAMLSRTPGLIVTRAESDFREALRMKRSLRLDPAHFSPKLIAFFEKQRTR